MSGFHGIIFAYSSHPGLRELVSMRNAASLPFCGRYRLIDFALSSMTNAGIRDVGVIMQRDYQSLLDHVGGGKAWDMSLQNGGLRMLPPFGLPEYHKGDYTGTIEALNAVSTYVEDIKQDNVVLMPGYICANIDLQAAIKVHSSTGASITAICCSHPLNGFHYRYITDENGRVKTMLSDCTGGEEGVASLECYIVKKAVLLEIMEYCGKRRMHTFHKDAIEWFLANGGHMGVYMHEGYATPVRTLEGYYRTNMDMLRTAYRRELFPASRPVRTKTHEEVNTYYAESAYSFNSLVADNCIIEGTIENCIIFSGVHIAKGAVVRNSIIMRGCRIAADCQLSFVIADKRCSFGEGVTLSGSPRLPILVPKSTEI